MLRLSTVDRYLSKKAQYYITSACFLIMSVLSYVIVDRILYARAKKLGQANPIMLNDYLANYNNLPLWKMLLVYSIPLILGAVGVGLLMTALSRGIKNRLDR